jgi:predicted XRE-type DNA-binding protein
MGLRICRLFRCVADRRQAQLVTRPVGVSDLGLSNPEERLTEATLASRIAQQIEDRGLTQIQAALRLGVDQPKISNLLRGRLCGFSTDRLTAFLNALDCDLIITIRRRKIIPPACAFWRERR